MGFAVSHKVLTFQREYSYIITFILALTSITFLVVIIKQRRSKKKLSKYQPVSVNSDSELE